MIRVVEMFPGECAVLPRKKGYLLLVTVFVPRKIAILPVRISSLIPNWRSSFSIALILSVSPTTWRITDFAPTSTIWARKIVAICMISARVEPWSAVTLNITSSRSTRSLSVRSETLITSMSLLLLHHLLDLCIVADHDNRDPAHVRLLAGTDREALDVKPAPGEEAGYPGEDTGPVLHKDG